MPKTKTHSGAKKRFKLTATGKVKRKHAFKRHCLSTKSTKQKRHLTHMALVKKTEAAKIKKMLTG